MVIKRRGHSAVMAQRAINQPKILTRLSKGGHDLPVGLGRNFCIPALQWDEGLWSCLAADHELLQQALENLLSLLRLVKTAEFQGLLTGLQFY